MMAPTSLNLPPRLKEEAEQWATRQGVSLDAFVLWAVAEKIGELKQGLDDSRFPRITYRRGASGQPIPVVRGTAIRVQTLAVESQDWQMSPAEIAEEHGLSLEQAQEALSFYQAYRAEIDASLAVEQQLESSHASPPLPRIAVSSPST
ncbi:MAG TPA: DUF433 domain-containing protein [Thermoanaerobaculia bacterium]|nr:DUF433 domain-containing protein [Thermoanaerobaculia bacterium]